MLGHVYESALLQSTGRRAMMVVASLWKSSNMYCSPAFWVPTSVASTDVVIEPRE